jgi:DNA-binding response OmpR family regulator
MRILIVEDDSDIRESLKLTLESEAFVVDCAKDGREGSYMARTNGYDVVILDNVLPYKLGIEVCREIRDSGKTTPILLLSVKSDPEEKAALLNAGVDDYLTKPHSHQELLARIRALTRRGPAIQSAQIQAGDLVLDTSTYEVRRGKQQIYLTLKEFSLLELLLKNKGKVVSRGAILEHVWDMDGDPMSKTIETHIVNLRKKIDKGPRKLIYNIPGRGYKIETH